MSPITPPFASCPAPTRAAVGSVLFDVDDTVTWQGRLPEEAALALYRAHEAGLSLVAVTGRSASWAELLLRLFPLDAAVAETGALCLVAEKGGRVSVIHSEKDERQRRENEGLRRAAADRVLREVPSARLALDNMGRLYDIAFDLTEDGPPMPAAEAARVRALLEEDGLTTAQSSVHVNAWIGRFDKSSMVERYLRERRGTSLGELGSTLLYVGDSKNDGSMFARAKLGVGVANIAPHLSWLAEHAQAPAYVTSAPGGHGFAEVVRLLLEAR
jgi:HAD superfamily hydrolase (TIGR01484 family)